jgi:hypothetical protein
MREKHLYGKKRESMGIGAVMECRSDEVMGSPRSGSKKASGRGRSMFMRVWCMLGRSRSRSGVVAETERIDILDFRIFIFDCRRGFVRKARSEEARRRQGIFYHGVRRFHGHGQSPLVSPRNAVFTRYTRYAATTCVNIDDFWDWSRYTGPLHPLHSRWLVIGNR